MNEENQNLYLYSKEIKQFGNNQGVFLVHNRYSGEQYIKKELEIYSLDVYQYLKDHHIENTPIIYAVVKEKCKLIVIEEYIEGTPLNEYIKKNGK